MADLKLAQLPDPSCFATRGGRPESRGEAAHLGGDSRRTRHGEEMARRQNDKGQGGGARKTPSTASSPSRRTLREHRATQSTLGFSRRL